MTTYIALLRAVNVGGTGKLPMTELKRMCESAGFSAVQTYIASGNVVFDSDLPAPSIKQLLEAALASYAGKPVAVMVRTGPEMQAVLDANPFPDAASNRVLAIFLDDAPAADALDSLPGRKDEQVAVGKREIYVHYGSGMGTSRLRIPAGEAGTARNINTVARLAAMAAR
ncbi:DUF1697 domain-containing protein [Massilia sp. PAMC28688]|uniref:DUF1697 domain-containing protein n=1 Tax=Massilia sp. PAMC28688 TaxID=2861283 RepID=UPI001C62930B|nr:DUF1697 domain-containing protein [Massilia sp. PAMC28688]QYF92949.1 DUF1697 domain-containing protein [Massilia sp. PAMC28688]